MLYNKVIDNVLELYDSNLVAMSINFDFQSDKNFRRFSIVSKETQSPLQWTVTNKLNNNFNLAYHTAVIVKNYFYIHGGVKSKTSNQPTNELYRANITTNEWEVLTDEASPFLSQHASVSLDERYFILIGGWNGHDRSSKVEIYDTKDLKWLKKPNVSGFSDKAGLSGHTANVCLKKKSSFPEILVIGREGSIRTQRKFGNIWKLSSNADLSHFRYSDIQIHMDSRSNHATGILKNAIYVVGGRDDKVIDVHKLPNLQHDNYCSEVANFVSKLSEYELEKCPLSGRRKAGRRGHCLISTSGGFFISGGASFMSATHVADAAAFFYLAATDEYFFMGAVKEARTNGAYAVSVNGEAYYHGGMGLSGDIMSEVLVLTLNK